ncbi:hypothetical protein [Helicobacter cappadocius]|uniref:Uncharacterized protein n=1 Tax=Helicobacter cappadocius TaxID=3063998 RepID=A0AA90TBP6_9HELI|nr:MULTISPECIES: hypothetical protein [unclassified Helicobacter]MDO7253025.1 hypothetical protein [Helicobacter sp. faydin-H75]MDP2538986.1 hypothetical protein [Helicobacter sp. faydin-H76]
MDFEYKLMMFGFSALCEDMEEVQQRLRQIPIERALAETIEQCYLIDLKSGEKFDITYNEKGFYIKN